MCPVSLSGPSMSQIIVVFSRFDRYEPISPLLFFILFFYYLIGHPIMIDKVIIRRWWEERPQGCAADGFSSPWP